MAVITLDINPITMIITNINNLKGTRFKIYSIIFWICLFAYLNKKPPIKTAPWDDALDVWGVHGVGGILGSILVGVFAEAAVNGTKGLIFGDVHQFLVQLFAVVFTGVYAFIVTFGILKVLDMFSPVRVSVEDELQGLDLSLHGEKAYDYEL